MSLKKIAEFVRPTALNKDFKVHSYQDGDTVLFALSRGDLSKGKVLVRIQSPCLFGESFGVNSCDCGQQLRDALTLGTEAEAFLLIYLSDQEGRGHGLVTKIAAISLEANEGMLMSESFDQLNLELDLRTYAEAAHIIRDLIGTGPIRLLTNNPKKIDGLAQHGIQVERVPLVIVEPSSECQRYLNNKRTAMGHLLPEFHPDVE